MSGASDKLSWLVGGCAHGGQRPDGKGAPSGQSVPRAACGTAARGTVLHGVTSTPSGLCLWRRLQRKFSGGT